MVSSLRQTSSHNPSSRNSKQCDSLIFVLKGLCKVSYVTISSTILHRGPRNMLQSEKARDSACPMVSHFNMLKANSTGRISWRMALLTRVLVQRGREVLAGFLRAEYRGTQQIISNYVSEHGSIRGAMCFSRIAITSL